MIRLADYKYSLILTIAHLVKQFDDKEEGTMKAQQVAAPEGFRLPRTGCVLVGFEVAH